MDKNRNLLAVGIIIVVAIGAFYAYSFVLSSGTEKGYDQVWWIASDPHIGVSPSSPMADLRTCIQDVNSLGIADRAIILGDLIHESPYYRDNFYQTMEELDVKKWYYILGNHDYGGGQGWDNLLPPTNKTLNVLGMRWVLISDLAGGFNQYSGGTLTENVREWATHEVVGSKKPVFVFTHQPPGQWNLYNEEFGPYIGGMKIRAWFYGHIHEWRTRWIENQMLSISDCSMDWAHHRNGIFMFLEKKSDAVEVTLKFRNHENGSWIEVPYPKGALENITFSVETS